MNFLCDFHNSTYCSDGKEFSFRVSKSRFEFYNETVFHWKFSIEKNGNYFFAVENGFTDMLMLINPIWGIEYRVEWNLIKSEYSLLISSGS